MSLANQARPIRTVENRRRIRSVVREVAEEFESRARETILHENFGKHCYEIGLMLDCAPHSVLDVGGGVGFNLLCLRRVLGSGPRLVLVDRFLEYGEENRMGSADSALQRLREAEVEIHSVDFWMEPTLPFEADSFDVITIIDVVEHLPGHPLTLLGKCVDVLRSRGSLILGGPNALALGRLLKLVRGIHPYSHYAEWVSGAYYGHFREYTPKEYADLLERVGLRNVRMDLVSEPTATRLRNGYHNGLHPRVSPTRFALSLMWCIEGILPRHRAEVYCIGSLPASG